MPSPTHEYYATLGVPRAASADQIRRAYRKLARQHHPDFNPGSLSAEERFKHLQEAYEVLRNSKARRQYDEATFGTDGAATSASAGARAATGFSGFEYTGWRKGGSDPLPGQSGFRYARPARRISDTSNFLMMVLFAIGSAGFFAMLLAFPIPEPLGGHNPADYWMLGPIALFVAAGFLFGGTAGNFWARAACVNAAVWCCLVPYWWIALKLPWEDTERMLPWALMTYLPIVLGVFLRQAATPGTR
jgi:hypothetical protein